MYITEFLKCPSFHFLFLTFWFEALTLHLEVLFYSVAIERCVKLTLFISLLEAVGELGLYATWTLEHLYNHCARVNARVVTWLRFNFLTVLLLLLRSCRVPLWLITVSIQYQFIMSDLISATWLSPSQVHSACFIHGYEILTDNLKLSFSLP
jgi:hypothetical protein